MMLKKIFIWNHAMIYIAGRVQMLKLVGVKISNKYRRNLQKQRQHDKGIKNFMGERYLFSDRARYYHVLMIELK